MPNDKARTPRKRRRGGAEKSFIYYSLKRKGKFVDFTY
jgi:hypothetical protein